MVWETLITGLPALAGGISNLISGNSAAKSQALQQAMMQRLAQQQMELATAGETDARGNRVYYVPGQGWVTDATPMTKAILGAGDTETLQQLTADAPLRREQLQRTARYNRALEPAVSGDIAKYQGPRTDPAQFAALAARSAGNAVARSADENAATIGRLGTRTGDSTSTGRAMALHARDRDRNVGDTMLNAILQGHQTGEGIRSSEDSRLGGNITRLMGGAPMSGFSNVPGAGMDVSPGGARAGAAGLLGGAANSIAGASRLNQSTSPWGDFLGDAGTLSASILGDLRKRPTSGGFSSPASRYGSANSLGPSTYGI